MTDKETEERLRYLEKQVTYLSIHLKLTQDKLQAADIGRIQTGIERLDKRSKLMATTIDETKERLGSHKLSIQGHARSLLRFDDRVAALESERDIALAAYRKTHPSEMRQLNKALGIKPKKKTRRSRSTRGAL